LAHTYYPNDHRKCRKRKYKKIKNRLPNKFGRGNHIFGRQRQIRMLTGKQAGSKIKIAKGRTWKHKRKYIKNAALAVFSAISGDR
jgi:hypothetical protein